MFPVRLVEKDFRYTVATAEAAGATVPISASVLEQLQVAMARRFDEEHLTAVAKLYQP